MAKGKGDSANLTVAAFAQDDLQHTGLRAFFDKVMPRYIWHLMKRVTLPEQI